ncbi:hypothetical protein CFC21_063780 [Triticum aestivum]|uniref:BGGP Beta-1-3-galactosyl-O-glycosyl-glycoprotein n=3 Tax=Triticum TaxID=4564 RepID=Q5BHU0_WHEAT|nr:beta-glucuronosyltransferase GlcAT14B-like [Triticum dicoccoides]XP_044379104.1 beta-glucuronosyltransferase GlcAT14B-like [Triticum aestivum]AAS88559.1 glycosylation enzyme-like protein [Triticum monococcum]KAF7056367.1 hypothetical protein CFC21_063780 [Triticum aestivum]CAH10044.1 BGGP Beta-1-3-galactosyl-O-glycosyl-glycoprotein [Triticum aestivum]CAJ13540.1 unnamed protein product [Triticum aestivum]
MKPIVVHAAAVDRRWLLPLAVGSALSLFLLVLLTTVPFPFFPSSSPSPALFVEHKLAPTPPASRAAGSLPRIAYVISGSAKDASALRRVLLALYHPRNLYVLHLDAEAPESDRRDLAAGLAAHPVIAAAGNVRVVERANLVTYRGPTMVASTLHAAAALLWGHSGAGGSDWDWFINLSASDYPLVTQDDLIHVFSKLPRDLNFIDHTSNIGWKEFQRAKPVIIDPGLYMKKKADVFWIPQRRSVPTAFKLFTGSAWMALSRSLVEYSIWGWDNLPRTVLMYYSNFISSPEGYFHTVVCNAEEFKNTTVNHDLHYISWDNPPKQHPHYLTMDDLDRMIASDAPFARKFHADEPVLDRIDAELLSRHAGPDAPTPGGWCAGTGDNGSDPCSVVGNTSFLQPGRGAVRLQRLVTSLLSDEKFHPRQCK